VKELLRNILCLLQNNITSNQLITNNKQLDYNASAKAPVAKSFTLELFLR
jgi:hypothetical protein